MSRFIDITTCLFLPPTNSSTEVCLRANEKIDYSLGDIEEYGGISDRVAKYHTMSPKLGIWHLPSQSELLTSEHSAGQSLLASPEDPRRRITKESALRSRTHIKEGKSSPAISLPYVTINKLDKDREELTVIYFHANSEDMMSSIKIGRLLSEFLRVPTWLI